MTYRGEREQGTSELDGWTVDERKDEELHDSQDGGALRRRQPSACSWHYSSRLTATYPPLHP